MPPSPAGLHIATGFSASYALPAGYLPREISVLDIDPTTFPPADKPTITGSFRGRFRGD
ncbi:hypothetical protein N657DRAFT_648324 [Parathielavia appendiculata]|uniref:Uncharacterized protein n=1 Tax=Parathielavia appendiculata TaxID=2587402 RepID=A0AAN6TUM5_9PEZI|nr:hypothetical protein N657DRAFT_648324 [Parathielavia appendiculata]